MSGTGTAASAPAVITPDFFSQVWDDAKAEAEKVWSEIETGAITVAEVAYADFKDVLSVGLPLAIQAVAAQVPALISGTEKFGAAAVSVGQQLEAQLGPVAWNDVQTVTQLGYQKLMQIAGGAPGPAPAAK